MATPVALLSASLLALIGAGSAAAAGAGFSLDGSDLGPMASGSTVEVPCSGTGGGTAGLIGAIVQADQSPGSWTISLAARCTYDFTSAYLGSDEVTGPDAEGPVGLEDWYGPSALPAIATDITIAGNGATLEATQPASPVQTTSGFDPDFRFFFVGADPLNADTLNYTTPGAGSLTLEDLTLTGGKVQGGDATLTQGGGGAGMGGAIFNQGIVTLDAVTATDDVAHGGDASGNSLAYGGGGGMGTAGVAEADGGGFGPGTFGGPTGGAAGVDSDGGGGGFAMGENGESNGTGGGSDTGLGSGASQNSADSLAKGGDGSGGGESDDDVEPGSGGAFGFGGGYDAGGGVGGGGGGEGGSGGFGGGGGSTAMGGFGGGAGGPSSFGTVPGFGGGAAGNDYGGGGAGMGGVLFNMQGTATIVNSTLVDNSAIGGSAPDTGASPGEGLGGAVFNLNGSVTANADTMTGNTGNGGAAIYDLVYDSVTSRSASMTVPDSIIYGGNGSADVAVEDPARTTAGSNLGAATVAATQPAILDSSSSFGGNVTFTGSFSNVDPQLGPPQDNGGPGMETEMPLAGSPALGAGSDCPATDERGVLRAADGCDLGAVQTVGAATHFSVSAPTPETAGDTDPVTVTALDANGNVAIGYSGTVHLTSTDPSFTNATGNATLTNGVGTFNARLGTAGAQTITATDTVDGLITGTSGSVSVAPAAADSFAVSVPATATAGTPVTLTVTAEDQFGNTASNYAGTVDFTSSDSGAVLPADTTLTHGTGSFQATFASAGPQTVTVTDTSSSSVTGTSGPITVTTTTTVPTVTQTTPTTPSTPSTASPTPPSPPAPSPPPASPPAPPQTITLPSNQFSYSKPKYDAKTGVVTVRVKLPGGGRVAALETGWDSLLTHPGRGKSHKSPNRTKDPGTGRTPGGDRFTFGTGSATASGTGTITLKVKPTPSGKLAAKGNPRHFRLNIWLVFTPTGGDSATKATLNLRLTA